MHEVLVPLFPLEVVLLPGAQLPLHIFEDRYKEMIEEAVKNDSEFGVVQAGEKGILNIGCTARVTRVVNRYPDGRMDILSVGQRRFEILSLDQDKSYLRGSVSFFDDEDVSTPTAEATAQALAALQALSSTTQRDSLTETGARLSFRIGDLIEDLQFRQLLLALRSEGARLKQIAEFVPEYVAKLKRLEHVHRVARLNGHGYLPTGQSD